MDKIIISIFQSNPVLGMVLFFLACVVSICGVGAFFFLIKQGRYLKINKEHNHPFEQGKFKKLEIEVKNIAVELTFISLALQQDSELKKEYERIKKESDNFDNTRHIVTGKEK